jgi:WD40 repeat protein
LDNPNQQNYSKALIMAQITANRPLQIKDLATLTPPSTTRAWMSAAHPTLPIVASASSDKSVRVYSLTSFTLLSTISGGHKRSIRSCAWKPNTKGESVLATGSFDASAGIWRKWETEGQGIKAEIDFTREDDEEEEDDEWRFSVILDGHESEIKSVAWSAGGQYLATCSRDKSVWIWEEIEDDNFETIAVLQEHEQDVKCVTWHPQEDLLASASYDDTIRLYREDLDDWTCVCVLNGHDATVWSLCFEPVGTSERLGKDTDLSKGQKALLDMREKSGSRLISSSDDMTIRVWRRTPKESTGSYLKGGIPSILKTHSIEEDWHEEARLPQVHERAIYSLDWSKRTGMVVSTGGDGKIIVYKERWKESSESPSEAEQHAESESGTADKNEASIVTTEWAVMAELEGAHDVFEVNHVCWALRRDKGKRRDDEEIIISTGDDGEVKAWTLE